MGLKKIKKNSKEQQAQIHCKEIIQDEAQREKRLKETEQSLASSEKYHMFNVLIIEAPERQKE